MGSIRVAPLVCIKWEKIFKQQQQQEPQKANKNKKTDKALVVIIIIFYSLFGKTLTPSNANVSLSLSHSYYNLQKIKR